MREGVLHEVFGLEGAAGVRWQPIMSPPLETGFVTLVQRSDRRIVAGVGANHQLQ
jgi:hypothetical protein